MTDRSKRETPTWGEDEGQSDPGTPLKTPPPPPPPAPPTPPPPRVEELDPDDAVVVLDEEPTEGKTCGDLDSGPRMSGRKGTGSGLQRAARPAPAESPRTFTPAQRILILDAWQRSALPATDFAPLVGLSAAALYKWKRLFEEHGPAGLEEKRGAPAGSKLPEVTKRTILLLKAAHPDWGQDRIHHELQRSQGLSASAAAIGRVLTDAGFVVEAQPTRPHGVEPQRFEALDAGPWGVRRC